MNGFMLAEALTDGALKDNLDSATIILLDKFEADLDKLEKDFDAETGYCVEEYIKAIESINEVVDTFMLGEDHDLTERVEVAVLRGLKWLNDLEIARGN